MSSSTLASSLPLQIPIPLTSHSIEHHKSALLRMLYPHRRRQPITLMVASIDLNPRMSCDLSVLMAALRFEMLSQVIHLNPPLERPQNRTTPLQSRRFLLRHPLDIFHLLSTPLKQLQLIVHPLKVRISKLLFFKWQQKIHIREFYCP